MRSAAGFRLFYDMPSTRARAEALVLISDILLLAAPLYHASAILERPTAGLDALMLLVWAGIPRAMARCLTWMERPRDSLKAFGFSAVFVLGATALILVGWEMIYTANPAALPLGLGTAALMILAWSSGFLLFQPRAYRLYDFLCGAVVLLALIEQKPAPWLWVPITFLALHLSSTTRHVLFDVHGRGAPGPPNLQNVRVLSGAGALLASALFCLAGLAFRGSLDFAPGERRLPSGAGRQAFSGLIAMPAAIDGTWGAAADDDRAAPGGEAALSEALDSDGVPGRFSFRMALARLARNPDDNRIALTAQLIQEPPGGGVPAPAGGAGAPAWPPRGALWRGVAFTFFDPEEGSWYESRPLETRPWPAGAGLTVRSGSTPGARPIQYEVVLPVFRTLASLTPVERFDVSGLESYRIDAAGDIFPLPPPEKGFRYRAWTDLTSPYRYPAGPEAVSRKEMERYLALPPAEKLGFDPVMTAMGIFPRRRASTERQIDVLRSYFRQNLFKYARRVSWRNGASPLRDFLFQDRVGNCALYSTAATILLRGGGIPARLVVGFGGGDWDEGGRKVLIRLASAHAWAEAYSVEAGAWIAVDPTAWVPAIDIGLTEAVAAGVELAPARPAASRESAGKAQPAPAAEGSWGGGSRRGGGGEDPAGGTRRRAERQNRSGSSFGGAAGEGEDFSDWFQLAGDEGKGPLDAASGAPAVPGGRAGFAGERADRAAAAPAAGKGEPDQVPSLLGRWRRALRATLLLLAAAVASGLLATFLRPRRQGKVSESEAADEEEDILSGPAPAAAGDGFSFDFGNPRESVIGGYHRLQADLARARNHRRAFQTPLEHGRRFALQSGEIQQAFATVVRLLYRALYGDGRITTEEARECDRSCRRIRKHLA